MFRFTRGPAARSSSIFATISRAAVTSVPEAWLAPVGEQLEAIHVAPAAKKYGAAAPRATRRMFTFTLSRARMT